MHQSQSSYCAHLFFEPVTHPYYYYITEMGVVKILILIIMSQEKKTECDVDNCPGLLKQASQSCVVCQAVAHPTCFMASTAQVKVTQRVNNASRQMSKLMMVRRLVAAKFGAGVEQATKPVAKTKHDKFCLLNCLFSDEIGALTASAETVSRVDLDNGAVGGKSNYWKMVAQRFNEGFPEG
jgi:hypothetical protein